MCLKLSLTLPLSVYKGEGTRTPQLTIDYHYTSDQLAAFFACHLSLVTLHFRK